MTQKRAVKVTQSTGSVFRDLGFPAAEAEHLLVRSDLVTRPLDPRVNLDDASRRLSSSNQLRITVVDPELLTEATAGACRRAG
jgi:hypothetical protein